ncbi:hypothetical protein BDP27DRAFT_1421963 [Rhodocollybia butyracea]|uniref:LisH domain-containing protein n=1 Tax=Rhodocollybia butyracea TaxID=206335 RepID=A0A9P5U7Z6_9AGAR|nr:hypothetical protein BDP27DRAFT_1421963 [Rhodocollybia butyracea]
MANVSQQGSGHSSAQNDPSYPQSPLSWEGDKMFNIYIYDYCFKRGFRKTARELLAEAEIPPESQPPINARQGLLFEWWSVFWVLFTAKANGNGTEDALIYTQHQANQANNRARGPQIPALGQPMSVPRSINGLPLPGSRPFPTNGQINGVGPGPSGGFHPGSHMNGIPPPVNQPGQNFPPPPIPGQPRPSLPGNPRNSAGGGPPFPSPTMANSPHNPGSGQHPSQQPPMMNPLGQSSPHIGSRMPPPPPNNMQGPPGSYPMPRPPSRTASPGQMGGGMAHRSPSMGNRQPMTQDLVTMDVMRIPPSALNGLKDELGLAGKDLLNMSMDEKQRINNLWRNKTNRKPGPPNAAAGPSTMPPPPRTRGKRNSSSPREDPENAPGTGSPPMKKPRRSPVETGPGYPHPPQQPGQAPGLGPGPGPGPSGQPGMGPPGPGGGPGPNPGHPPNTMGMRPPMPGGPMNGFGPPMGGQMGGQMGGGMGGGIGPHPPHPMSSPSMSMNQPGMMTPQMQPMNPQRPSDGQYRNSLVGFHRQIHVANGGAGSPSDPTFGGMGGGPGGPGNRSPQFPGGPTNRHKPMPPPSPGMNQMNKDNSKDSGMNNHDSPRNGMVPPPSAGMTPTGSGPNSSTPAPQGGPGPLPNSLSGPSQSQNSTPIPNPNANGPPPSSMDHSVLGNPQIGMMPNGGGGMGGGMGGNMGGSMGGGMSGGMGGGMAEGWAEV